MMFHALTGGAAFGHYDPDSPQPLNDAEAELLLVLLHRYQSAEGGGLQNDDLTIPELVDDLAMSMSPTTDLADRIRQDLGA